MNIKRMLLFLFVIIFIPFAVVNIFIKKDEIKFNYTTSKIVKVKLENEEIIKVPLEKYIYGVVASEMPVSFNTEALKAQAVAARTYALYNMEANKDKDYDLFSTDASQVYQKDEQLKEKWQDKYIEYSNKIKKVILDTKGEYLTYEGKAIAAFFFSTSPGYTENSEDVFSEVLPYARSVESKWDLVSPALNDEVTYTKEEFYNKLGLKYNNILNITDINKSNTGRTISLKINNQEFKASTLRTKLGLRSTFFDIKEINNQIVIKTKGFGHGVGMSQYGANGMADAGFNYKDILKYYYQGVKIEKLKK